MLICACISEGLCDRRLLRNGIYEGTGRFHRNGGCVDLVLSWILDLQQACATIVVGRRKCSLVSQDKFKIGREADASAPVFQLNAAVDLGLDPADKLPMSAHG